MRTVDYGDAEWFLNMIKSTHNKLRTGEISSNQRKDLTLAEIHASEVSLERVGDQQRPKQGLDVVEQHRQILKNRESLQTGLPAPGQGGALAPGQGPPAPGQGPPAPGQGPPGAPGAPRPALPTAAQPKATPYNQFAPPGAPMLGSHPGSANGSVKGTPAGGPRPIPTADEEILAGAHRPDQSAGVAAISAEDQVDYSDI